MPRLRRFSAMKYARSAISSFENTARFEPFPTAAALPASGALAGLRFGAAGAGAGAGAASETGGATVFFRTGVFGMLVPPSIFLDDSDFLAIYDLQCFQG